eukprot:TRINITY_DN7156_c0_g1_i2.p2 TRINITY_DN7156_c0_g1~~TRINITY_DN7156_c0_g1_i2.p2  ORF type:complete len:150 (-),score=8.74 TRINITY_DN7156_c0_g1_i2:396-845(-)
MSESKSESNFRVFSQDEWLTKIQRYCKVAHIQVKSNPVNSRDPTVQKNAEGKQVLKHIQKGEQVILLDERGKQISSHEMSEVIAKAGDMNKSLVFLIGGPYGHGQEVVQRADQKIALSNLVLNHQIALLVTLEQIYRGWTILKGEPYHH